MENIWNNEKLSQTLEDGVVVMPTDTLYGIVGRARNVSTVNRIYEIRKRSPEKPCIILIGNIKELANFSIILPEKQKRVLQEYWPGPVSVVLDCEDEFFFYLHRGTKTLAFRMPLSEKIRALLTKVGPLIAPSANPEGLSPAEDISKAEEYFGTSVDMYVDGGKIYGKASKVIKLHKDGSVTILRE